jgi:hypothetical protein
MVSGLPAFDALKGFVDQENNHPTQKHGHYKRGDKKREGALLFKQTKESNTNSGVEQIERV